MAEPVQVGRRCRTRQKGIKGRKGPSPRTLYMARIEWPGFCRPQSPRLCFFSSPPAWGSIRTDCPPARLLNSRCSPVPKRISIIQAHVVGSSSAGEVPSSLEGNRPAFAETYLVVSNTSRQRIDDWYAKKLKEAGWHFDSRNDPNVSYTRGTRESFTIWFFKAAPTGVKWDGTGTLYSIGYQIAPCSRAGVSC